MLVRDGRVLVTQRDWRQELEVLDPKTGNRKPLDWLDWAVLCCISDDGKTIVFDETGSGVDGHATVFLRNIDERSPVKLGPGRAIALSPDGKWVVAFREDTPGKLWFLPTGPGESHSVSVPLGGRLSNGAFFRDGRRLALIGRERPDGRYQLFVFELETSKLRPLSPKANPAATSKPAISPDGSLVATIDPDGWVSLSPTDGGEPVRLTGLGAWQQPDGWLSDGTLLVHNALALPSAVTRFDPATGRHSPFTTVAPSDPAGVQQIRRVRLTPDGETMVLNYGRVSGGLFLLDWRDASP